MDAKIQFSTSISGSRLKAETTLPFVQYEILCEMRLSGTQCNDRFVYKWKVWKRYNQFLQLHKAMDSHYGWNVVPAIFPSTRKFTFNKFSESYIRQRKNGLNEYWTKLVAIPDATNFVTDKYSAHIREFLNISEIQRGVSLLVSQNITWIQEADMQRTAAQEAERLRVLSEEAARLLKTATAEAERRCKEADEAERLRRIRQKEVAELVCIICDETCYQVEGYECSQHHFICRRCFNKDIIRLSSDSYHLFKQRGCQMICVGCKEVIEDRFTCNLIDQSGLAAFNLAKKRFHEEMLVQEYEGRMHRMREDVEREIIAANHRHAVLIKHSNHIIEEILTIKCPNRSCKIPFIMDDSFSECFSLQCMGCGHNFCGWCLVDCGTDAHAHVIGCRPERTSPRGLFPQNDNNGRHSAKYYFDRVHGPRRAEAVKAYLDCNSLPCEDRKAIIRSVSETWDLMKDNILLSY